MPALRDAVVVVTGAASGIGRAVAEGCLARGARVHLVDLEPGALGRTVEELRARGLAPAGSHALDCRDGAALQALAARLEGAHGRVDGLVNNAGAMLAGPVERLPLEDWRWLVDTNLWTVLHGVRAFLPGMLARGRGRIVNTASMAGLVGFPLFSPYSATKFAVVGLSQSLDAELAPRGVRVSAVCPGFVRTGAFQAARFRLPAAWLAAIGFGFQHLSAEPGQVAEAILGRLEGEGGGVVSLPRETWPMHAVRRLSPALYARLYGALLGPLSRAAAARAQAGAGGGRR